MLFPFKTKRSGGAPVTQAVHRLLARGNAARDREDWAAARAAYGRALLADPGLGHIWVQLGHAAKESGDRTEAARAYAEAARLRPDDPDPHLQLGHLLNREGDWARAAPHYLRAAQADPGSIDAATALHRALARARGPARAELMDLLLSVVRRDAVQSPPEPVAAALAGPAFVFDISDLVLYFAHGRSPTGIQRVQIQIITHALRRPAGAISLCCFIDGRDAWLAVPMQRFLDLVALSASGSDRTDPAWVTALNRLHLDLALAPDYAFPRGGFLVNLGSSWQLPNYFLFVRAARARYGIRYVPFVHDLIPVLAPQYFVRAARQEVVPWLLGVFTHADHVLVNSESTKRDLVRVAAETGYPIDPAAIAVVRLDADYRTHGLVPVPPPAPAEPFVLLVSTVESRKGHATAFAAWAELIARHGAARVPPLVCVGKRGWLSADIYRRLQQDTLLASRVVMRSGVADAELAGLYQACLFTIYPSFYEGWGLPITEALSYGKPVIAAETSSLPEAGGEFAVYVPPGDTVALAAAVERMVFDAAYREAVAGRIGSGFRPREWGDLADQVQAELAGCPARPVRTPSATMGAYHSLARGTASRLWAGAGSGEVFRAGTGWTAPGAVGSWTGPGGGRLSIPVPPGAGPLRLGLWLLGAATDEVTWCIQVRDGPALTGTLIAGARKWAVFDAPNPSAAPLELLLWAETEAEEAVAEPAQEPPTVGLAGFFVHARDDAAAAQRLLQAIALGNLDDVDAYRPPPPVFEPVDWAAASFRPAPPDTAGSPAEPCER